jgi:methionyl-tRNA formyltransferase
MQGESVTGVTLMLLDEGMDTGDVIAREEVDVEVSDNAHTLRDKLASLGARMVVEVIPLYVTGAIVPQPQDEELATYADPVDKSETLIAWTQPAAHVHNQVRALSPRPGAYTHFRDKRLKVLRTSSASVTHPIQPGVLEIAAKDILIAGTGAGSLQLEVLQPEGKQPMSAADFLHGYRLRSGEALV